MIVQERILSHKIIMKLLVEINYKIAVAIAILIIYINGCVTNENIKITVRIDCIDSKTEKTFNDYNRNCLMSI